MERYLWFAGGVAVGIIVGSRVGRAPYGGGVVTAAQRIWARQVLRDAAGATRTEARRLYRRRIRGLSAADRGDETASDSTHHGRVSHDS